MPELRLVAVDIGATKFAIAVEHGERAWSVRTLWSGDGPAQLEQALGEARARLDGRVDRVGVACAPTLDRDGRVMTWPSRPAWCGQPLRDLIAGVTGAPVLIGDDGALAALAEADTARTDSLLYLGIGTGLAGGVVAGGRLLSGADGGTGELGHLPVGGRQLCRCGRAGCLQATVCGAALAATASRYRRRPASETDLVTGLALGRTWARRTCERAAAALARAVVVVSEVVPLARVHIGGGLGHVLADLTGCLTTQLVALRRPARPGPLVARAEHGPDSSLAGALLVARRGFVHPTFVHPAQT